MADEVTGGAAGESQVAGAPPAEAAGSPDLASEVLAHVRSAPVSTEAPPARPSRDPEFLKQLESLDPSELPDPLRVRFEKPFLSQYTKKTTDFDEERKSYLGLIQDLQSRLGNEAPKETQDEVAELLANGDYGNAVAKLKEQLRSEPTPERIWYNSQQAVNEAKTLMPDLNKYEGLVAERFTADPTLVEMSRVAGGRYTGKILAGLAFQAENAALKAELSEANKNFEARVKMAVEETQRRIQKLPSSVTRGGITTGEPAPKSMSLRDALNAAYVEQGGQ